MKRPRILCIVIAILMAGWFFRHRAERFDQIEYQGQLFKLTKAYCDYDDYKDDPHNLATGQEGLIEQAVVGAKLKPLYQGRDELIHAAFDARFPGYGMTSYGERAQPDGTILSAHAVEIPLSTKQRVFVYQKGSGPYSLVDDFVLDGDREIRDVSLKNGKIEYTDLTGKVIATHNPRGAKERP